MGKSVAFGIITVISSTALCAALGLGFFYVRARLEPFPRSDLRMEGDWPLQRDDEIGFVAVKNGRTLRSHLASGLRYHLFTDDRGARVNAPGEQTPPRVDLLTIGCSFSWGHGVENEETFTEGLRRRLGVTVANLAMGSYGTVHSLLLWRRHLDLRPRVVVYGFIDDHLRRNLSPCAPSYAPSCLPVAHVTFAGNGTPTIQPPPRGSLLGGTESTVLRGNHDDRSLLHAGRAVAGTGGSFQGARESRRRLLRRSRESDGQHHMAGGAAGRGSAERWRRAPRSLHSGPEPGRSGVTARSAGERGPAAWGNTIGRG